MAYRGISLGRAFSICTVTFLAGLSSLQAGVGELTHNETAAAIETESDSPSDRVPFRATPRGLILDGEHGTAELDLFAPLFQTPAHLLFADIRGLYSDGLEPGYSLGLGYRILLDHPGLILGGNLFLDSSQQKGWDRQDQIGLGLELLSRRFDLRVNGYLPLGDEEQTGSARVQSVSRSGPITVRQSFVIQRFENPMQAIDAEAGLLVPYLDRVTDVRIFGGIYLANAKYHDDPQGWYTRAEWSPVRALVFEGGYSADFDSSNSGAWYGGVRINFEFGGPPAKKQVAGLDLARSSSLRDRRDEYIHRNPLVGTESAYRIDPHSVSLKVTGYGRTLHTATGTQAMKDLSLTSTSTNSASSSGSSGGSYSSGTVIYGLDPNSLYYPLIPVDPTGDGTSTLVDVYSPNGGITLPNGTWIPNGSYPSSMFLTGGSVTGNVTLNTGAP